MSGCLILSIKPSESEELLAERSYAPRLALISWKQFPTLLG